MELPSIVCFKGSDAVYRSVNWVFMYLAEAQGPL